MERERFSLRQGNTSGLSAEEKDELHRSTERMKADHRSTVNPPGFLGSYFLQRQTSWKDAMCL